jgi:dolichol-phosphate mannosyltransferase
MSAINNSIIIPTFNEEHNIGALIDFIKAYDKEKSEIIVVDGGSSDFTVEIAKNKEVKVIELKEASYNKAIIEGIKNAMNNKITILPGDIYYDPKNIIISINKHNDEDSDFIIFTRNYSMSDKKERNIYKIFNNYIFNILFGTKLSDINSGIYQIKSKKYFLETVSNYDAKKYLYGNEIFNYILISYIKNNKKISEIPIEYIPKKYYYNRFKIVLDSIKKIYEYINLKYDKS